MYSNYFESFEQAWLGFELKWQKLFAGCWQTYWKIFVCKVA